MSDEPKQIFRLVLKLKYRPTRIERDECSTCPKSPLRQNFYQCLQCFNVKFCPRCFEEDRRVSSHSNQHAMVYLYHSTELFGRSVTSNDLTLENLRKIYADEKNESIICDGCSKNGFTGLRFKCDSCFDYDLCDQCFTERKTTNEHPIEHQMLVESHRSIRRIDPKEIRLEEKLGKGSFGEVYRGRWTTKNCDVACKLFSVPDVESSNQTEKSFFRELRSYNELSGGFILKIFAYSMTKSNGKRNYMIVMEYMNRGSLRNFLQSEEKLSLRRKLQMSRQIITGIRKLHEHRIVHRDIRPDNILVDDKSNVKIADLGIAWFNDSPLNEISHGCPAFLPPEVRTERNITEKFDIFTFALTLNEFFTEIRHDFVQNEIYLRAQSPIFAELIRRCLANEIEKRPNAKEIETIFQSFLQAFQALVVREHPNFNDYSRQQRDELLIQFHRQYH